MLASPKTRFFTIGVCLVLLVVVFVAEFWLLSAEWYFLTHLPSVPSWISDQIYLGTAMIVAVTLFALVFWWFLDSNLG